MRNRKALTSVVLILAAVVLALGSAPAAAQINMAIGPAVQNGTAAYSATGRSSDVCLAVYLLDDTGYLHFLRYRLVKAFQTVGVVTGTFVPVFVTYTPVAAPFPVQRCAGGPQANNLVSNEAFLPQLYVVFAPTGTVTEISVNNLNFASIIQIQRQIGVLAGTAQANGCAGGCGSNEQTNSNTLAQLQEQFAAIFQKNVNNNYVNTAVGFGGFEVPWQPTFPAALLNAQTSCGAPYAQNGGTGSTCSPPLQGSGAFSGQSF
ncbi:MAG: hypothetical protein AB7O65_04885 [Candidatus Korobacteraceae bacterium]